MLDQNLSYRLVAVLSAVYPASSHVSSACLDQSPDSLVWNFTKANGFAIVSKDNDFQQRALLYGHPPKVIWIRLGNCSTSSIAALLQSRLVDIEAFNSDPSPSFLALS